MLVQAKNNISNTNVKFELADALEYLESQLSESVDVIFSGYTLHNLNRDYRLKVLNKFLQASFPLQ